ncbi:MAG: type II toxin-antitoxin system Phd/YefM family antitoxin [Chloroflexi bacterium]|nr:type II toxin-antitoxin system Phd/YefM family antitoxin [Chloroflexota bacterium]MBK8933856.1 type II toxin-antitoxin system Phd/YefM family antitoxin [Chloroflexota bacterium]
MQKIIGVTEMQRNFRAVFDEVANENTPYVLTRGSRPEVALIPYETFLQLMQWQEQEVFSRFDRLAASIATANEDYTEEEVQADVAEALAAVRKQA